MITTLSNIRRCLTWHLFFGLILSLNAHSAYYSVNKEHSKLKFNIKYMGLTDVEGQFRDYQIYFEKDANRLKTLEGQIKLKSINTFDKKRDQHLSKPAFFDTKKFPIAKFELKSPIDLKVKSKAIINLTIKGITKEIPIEIKYLGMRVDPWTKKEAEYFEGSFEIDRFDFAIKWNKEFDGGFVVDKKARIEFIIEAYQSNEKPAFSRFYLPTKNIKREIDLNNTVVSNRPIPTKKIETEKKAAAKVQYSSPSNVALTLFTSAIVFALAIIVGIFAQVRIVKFLESKNVSDNLTLFISSTIVTAFIVAVFILTKEYTGIGVHPLLR